MSVEIDEARSNDEPARIDFAGRTDTGTHVTDCDDAIPADPDISGKPRVAGSIEDASAANEQVEARLLSAEPDDRSCQQDPRQCEADRQPAPDDSVS
jgi:hypothetical protein